MKNITPINELPAAEAQLPIRILADHRYSLITVHIGSLSRELLVQEARAIAAMLEVAANTVELNDNWYDD